jgi:hypothetical protein
MLRTSFGLGVPDPWPVLLPVKHESAGVSAGDVVDVIEGMGDGSFKRAVIHGGALARERQRRRLLVFRPISDDATYQE